MNLGLADKCTIITGGSGGIGRGLVLGFAEEGANVIIATRDGKKGQEVADAAAEFPGQVQVIPTDVTDADAVDAMVEATVERFGPSTCSSTTPVASSIPATSSISRAKTRSGK